MDVVIVRCWCVSAGRSWTLVNASFSPTARCLCPYSLCPSSDLTSSETSNVSFMHSAYLCCLCTSQILSLFCQSVCILNTQPGFSG